MITELRTPAEPLVRGLSSEEAAEALRLFGPNVAAVERRMPAVLTWAARIATDPMAMLLVVASLTYTILGDRTDAIVLGIALLPIVLVGVVLEGRADAALARLRELTAPRALVVRDGVEQDVRASEIVPGDVLVLAEGDVVAADAELLSGRLAVDESALTGESIPVERAADEAPAVSAGTTVVGGRALARVTATGAATRYGAIAVLLGRLKPPRTPIETAIRHLVARLSVVVAVICVAVVLIERAHGSPWTVAVIAAVSLAMAAVPEELPMVYTLYLALGAWRLSRDRALVRRLASVETLGSTSTICVDKTGTLTYGRVEVAEIVAFDGADRSQVIETALLASEPHGSDPLDAAFARAATRDPRASATLLEDTPYEARRRYAAKRWQLGEESVQAVKGALEVVLTLAGSSDERAREALHANDDLAARGMRVLAVARAAGAHPLRLLGLAAFRDPVREDAPDALAACRAASVRVVMITGDHPATASAVARACGFGDDAERVVTGDALAAAPPDQLTALVDGARVFARTHPEQKLTIVRALRASGQVVAMTGDGTNDALALREADIGIAMGERGTEVAREAAGLVLLDDDISTIVRAIRNGRRIFDNLRRAFGYLVGFHVPLIVPAIVLPSFGLPLLLAPIHFVWLELIVHPVSSLVFESDRAQPGTMRRPPRPRSEGLLRRRDWIRAGVLGLTLAVVVALVYVYGLSHGIGENAARAAALIAMFCGQTALVFVERSPDRPVWRAVAPTRTAVLLGAFSLASLACAIAVPSLALLLHLAAPPVGLALTAAAIGAAATLWWEPFKR
jgi:P-type Ca2+ transporter type 2C